MQLLTEEEKEKVRELPNGHYTVKYCIECKLQHTSVGQSTDTILAVDSCKDHHLLHKTIFNDERRMVYGRYHAIAVKVN